MLPLVVHVLSFLRGGNSDTLGSNANTVRDQWRAGRGVNCGGSAPKSRPVALLAAAVVSLAVGQALRSWPVLAGNDTALLLAVVAIMLLMLLMLAESMQC